MEPICAAGGIRVEESRLKNFEASLEDLCQRFGFPAAEEFKWSPGRELWMHDNLVKDDRTRFFVEAAECARNNGVIGVLVCEDTNYRTLTNTASHEVDVVRLLLERIHAQTSGKEQDLTDFADGRIKTIHSQAFGYVDGLRSLECNFKAQPSIGKTRAGQLWFATTAGLAMIDPARIQMNKIAPEVQIERMSGVKRFVWSATT